MNVSLVSLSAFRATNMSWRSLFRQYLASARVAVFDQLLRDEIQGIDGTSKILISNVDTTERLLERYTELSGSTGLPSIVVAKELTETTALDQLNDQQQSATRIISLEQLGRSDLTYAFLHIHTDRSELDILRLLRQVYDSLATNGKLFVSRRNRDGLEKILHAAGVKVPGWASSLDGSEDRLRALAAEAGFRQNGIRTLEKTYLASSDELQLSIEGFRTTLAAELDSCEPDSGWRATFDSAAHVEMTEHGGVLLIANVLIATKVA